MSRGDNLGEKSNVNLPLATVLSRRSLFAVVAALAALLGGLLFERVASAASYADVIESVQPKIVKIYGAGGVQGLEAYQSGFLVSGEGHILTSWSYVLDTDFVSVTLNDGRKFQAEFLGHDPRVEIALLKIDAVELPYFNLDDSVELQGGDRVLAFSNLYGVATGNESASVLHGTVSAASDLAARRGAFETPYHGPVYVLDAMTNNPGAAGGALTNRQGQLAGILGKELRNSLNNTWLNYAIPVASLAQSIDDIRAGKLIPREPDENRAKPIEPVTLAILGITLVPDVLDRTPPFIDRIRPDSPADKAKLRVDDLILFVDDHIASSCKTLRDELSYIDRINIIRFTIQRGQELVDIEVDPSN